MPLQTLCPNAGCPWVVRISTVNLHTRHRTFPPQRTAQHLPPPSNIHHICATAAQSFILRCFEPVTRSSNRHNDCLKERVARLFERLHEEHKPDSARIHPPYLSAHSILDTKALPRISEDSSIRSTHYYIFHMRRCETFSRLLWRCVYIYTHGSLSSYLLSSGIKEKLQAIKKIHG
jgi:hypothetical protein